VSTVKDSIQNAVIMLFCDRGGFAVVRRCVHKESNSQFAVKIISVGNMRKKGMVLSYISSSSQTLGSASIGVLYSYTHTRTLIKLTSDPS